MLLLTLSWRRPLSYRNQSINLLCKSMDWFLYKNGFRHERVKANTPVIEKSVNWLLLQLVSNWLVSIILKLMKNAFYFTLKALFVLLKIFRFFATTWNKLHIDNFAWDGDIYWSNHLKCFIKFHKIHGETAVPESLF